MPECCTVRATLTHNSQVGTHHKVDTKLQTFTVDVVYRLIWRDDRLRFNLTCFQPDLFGGPLVLHPTKPPRIHA